MKIVVTGASGFIGSHFLQYTLSTGDHTVIAVRRNSLSQPRISLLKQTLWINRQLKEFEIDDLQVCYVLVHLANLVMYPTTNSKIVFI